MKTPRAWASIVAPAALLGLAAVAAAQDPRGTVPPHVPPAGQTVAPRETGVMAPPPAPDFQGAVAAAIARFAPAYKAKGGPRVAVYWNRQLSDRLSQWDSLERNLTTDKRVDITHGLHPDAEKGDSRRYQESETANISQRMGRDPRRASPGETWEWEFQSGFLDPFMRAGTKIVDRAAILRITAANTVGRIGRPQSLDAQLVEVDALRGHADVFVEVLFRAAPGAPGGQELLAVVKDVNSGQLLAHVTSRNAAQRLAPTREYIATSRGIEPRDVEPPLQDVASNLAINVMDALLRYWSD
jgi:hypothetical protein